MSDSPQMFNARSLETAAARPMAERRTELRSPVDARIWLIDNRSNVVLRTDCVDASDSGLRLRLPIGFGIVKGRTYQLCSHMPGQSAPPGLGLSVSRPGKIVRTRFVRNQGEDMLELGIRLEPQVMRVTADDEDAVAIA